MQTVPSARLAGFYFAYFAYVGAFGPYISLYLQSLGMSALEIGVLLALTQLMRVFAPHLWAALADRTGARIALLAIAMAGAPAVWSAVFFTSTFAGLFAVLALLAFFTSAALPVFETLVFAYLRDDLGRYGLLRIWGSIGFIFAVLAAGPILDSYGVQVVAALVLAPLVAALAVTCTLRDAPGGRRHGAGEPVWPVLRRPQVAALFAACFLMSVAHGPLYTFYSIHLADAGYDKTLIGACWSIGVLAEIAVFLLMPRLLARWSLAGILAASFVCAVLRFVMIGWGVSSFSVLLVAQLLHAATFGTYHTAALGLVNESFRDGQRARGQALYTSLSFGAGGMVGGLASGLAWDAIGPAWTFTAASGCAALGLLLLAGTARQHAEHRRVSR